MSTAKTDPYTPKKEVTTIITQKIGELTFELEIQSGRPTVGIRARYAEDRETIFLEDMEPYQLERLSDLLLHAKKESEELNAKP